MAQGYAYPVGASGSTGSANSVTVPLSTTGVTTIWTAALKTQINSVLITNTSGGILPVYLYLRDSDESTDEQILYTRVLKNRYAVMPLVAGDPRVGDTDSTLSGTLTEIILNTGDILKASCPVAGAINITVNFSEGVK